MTVQSEHNLERDVRDHAKTISEVIQTLGRTTDRIVQMETREAVQAERAKHVDERFDRIERRLDGIASLGRWVLAAFGGTFVAAVATFIVSGGLTVG